MLNGFSDRYQLDEPISKLSVVGFFFFLAFSLISNFVLGLLCLLKTCSLNLLKTILLRTFLSKHRRSKTDATLCSVLSGLHILHV